MPINKKTKVEKLTEKTFFRILFQISLFSQANERQIQCKLVGIRNGDTLTCLHQHNRLKIRLNDIDMLESRQSQHK